LELCPVCKTALGVQAARYEIMGDNSADTETVLFYVQELVCRNPHCTEHGKILETRRLRQRAYTAEKNESK